ncbi:MAG TPA: MarR family transcriptional regulator [Nocardioidaceae bacterium]|nr:MarR family transcriptional regulator [Nocardioidaceae bacterium]
MPSTSPLADPRSHDEPTTAEEAVMLTLARLGRRMRQRMPGEELDFGTILLMKALVHDPLRLTDLAAAVELDASTVSRQVRHLEDRGLLERTGDPDDRRASRIGLSPEGRTRLEAGARRRREYVGHLLDDWPPEDREQLRLLLNRLLDKLDPKETS